MELGFWLAIAGIFIVLLATIFFFSNGYGAYTRLANGTTTEQATPVGSVKVPSSIASSIGWVVGAIAIIAGGIWGTISVLRRKKDVPLSQLVPFLAQQAAPKATTPTPVAQPQPVGLSPEELAALRALLTK